MALRRDPTPEEIEALLDPNVPDREMKLRFRVGATTLQRWKREYRDGVVPEGRGLSYEPQALGGDEGDPIAEGVWPVDRMEFKNGLWVALERVQEEVRRLETEQFEVTLTIPDKRPILICFLSDLHIGHTQTSMGKLRQDLETIRNTDGMYAILGGDITDNVVTSVASRGMHHEQLTNVEIQKYLADEFVHYLGADKILTMLLGNHDEWSMKNDDFNPIAYLCKQIGCPYLGAFGYVNVALGSQVYRILAAHQFRMNSSFNKTHAAKRLMDFIGDADVVFTGHKHDGAAETVKVRRQDRFYAQAGTYLKHSVYGQRLGFPESSPEMPGVLLFPDKRKFLGIYSVFDEGVWMLEAARERYAVARV